MSGGTTGRDLAALFAGARPQAAPAVPDWARDAFAGRAPARTGENPGEGAAQAAARSFRIEVDGILARIDLPQVGAAFLDSDAAGLAMYDAAARLRLAPPMDRHAPGLRGLPERGAGGGGYRTLPPLPALARLIRRIQRQMPASATRHDPVYNLRLFPMLAERPLAGPLRALNRRLRPLRRCLAHVPLAPAHNRLVPARLRRSGTGLQALGWQAADRNDPVWDPALLSEAAGMDRQAAERLLARVLGRPPRPAERARLVLYRAMAPALEAAEADLRMGRGADAGLERQRRDAAWRRAQRQLAGAEFRHAVGVLGRGGRGRLSRDSRDGDSGGRGAQP
ncbi:MAG: hypothetical protein RIB84_17420 [Sneathiellaceae bacterium]